MKEKKNLMKINGDFESREKICLHVFLSLDLAASITAWTIISTRCRIDSESETRKNYIQKFLISFKCNLKNNLSSN